MVNGLCPYIAVFKDTDRVFKGGINRAAEREVLVVPVSVVVMIVAVVEPDAGCRYIFSGKSIGVVGKVSHICPAEGLILGCGQRISDRILSVAAFQNKPFRHAADHIVVVNIEGSFPVLFRADHLVHHGGVYSGRETELPGNGFSVFHMIDNKAVKFLIGTPGMLFSGHELICCGIVSGLFVHGALVQGEVLAVRGDGDDILHIAQVHVFFTEFLPGDPGAFLCDKIVRIIYADQGCIGHFACIRYKAVVACQVEGKEGKKGESQDHRRNDLQRPVEEGAEIIFIDDLHDAGSNDDEQQHPDDGDDESAAAPDGGDEEPCKKSGLQRDGDADYGFHRVEDDRAPCPLVSAQTAADPGEEKEQDGQSQKTGHCLPDLVVQIVLDG